MDMRIMKCCLGILAACGVLFGVTRVAAEVSVTDVTAVPRYPWNGLVDIQCTVSGSGGGNGWFEFAVAAVDAESGNVRDVTHFHVVRDGASADDKEVSADGEYKLLWNARADLGTVIVSNMVVRVTVRARDKEGHAGIQLWEGGPYWAETNIGADHPWEYGYFFWWGDTVGYRWEGSAWVASDGSADNFSFSEGNTPTYDKYNEQLQSEGWITAKGVLAPEHDAAQVQWGEGWRMPTDQELEKLINNCDWTWTTMNGVYGYVVRGRGYFAMASIFVPSAGLGWGTSHSPGGGILWSSVPHSGDEVYRCSWLLCCFQPYDDVVHTMTIYMTYQVNREIGHSVRPVRGAAE